MKFLCLFLYYAILQYIPMQPMPGYKIGYALRRWCVRRILGSRCGKGVVVKDHCYFGNGARLSIGDNLQMGQNAKLLGSVAIGKDVLMGPDVVIMATSHGYANTDIPIRMQPGWEKPIVVGDNVWIGTRVIILPGVNIGNNCIIGSGAVVTHSFPDNSIIGGVPAKLLKTR
ncbi:MAG: acyltransferase [Kiritimatiellia bacterium]